MNPPPPSVRHCLPGYEPRFPRRTSCSPLTILIKAFRLTSIYTEDTQKHPSTDPFHIFSSILLPHIISCSRFVRKSVATDNHVINFSSGKRFGLFDTSLMCVEGKTTRQKRGSLKLLSVASLYWRD